MFFQVIVMKTSYLTPGRLEVISLIIQSILFMICFKEIHNTSFLWLVSDIFRSHKLILNPKKVTFCFGIKEEFSRRIIKPKQSKSSIDAIMLLVHF